MITRLIRYALTAWLLVAIYHGSRVALALSLFFLFVAVEAQGIVVVGISERLALLYHRFVGDR